MGGQVMGRKGVNILGNRSSSLGVPSDSVQEGCALAAGPDEVKRDDGPEERGNVTPCPSRHAQPQNSRHRGWKTGDNVGGVNE
jgi:hypothetical protein